MIALLQRVSVAQVVIDGVSIAAIGPGLLVLVGVETGDTEKEGDRLLEKILNYRVFADAAGKMNLSLRDTGGGVLLVPQFTLAAYTRKGLRPDFSGAAAPESGHRLFEHLAARAQRGHTPVARGRFGADMQVTLTNDGPVTFWLQVQAPGKPGCDPENY